MTSASSNQRSPFSQLKEQIFGNPERSLKEAYEAASRIKSIENQYFSGYRVPVESLTNDRLRAEMQKNLEVLQSRIQEFNASSSASGNLGSNSLEKLIFVEGVLANYTMTQNQASALTTVPQQGGGQSPLSPTNIVDVPSSIEPARNPNLAPPSQRRQPNNRSGQGIFNTSVSKAFNQISQELNPQQSEQQILDEFRRSRQITVVAIRLLALLIVIPILTQQVSKNLVIKPIVEQTQTREEVVLNLNKLNSEWKEEALVELNTYEEEMKMEQMLKGAPPIDPEVMEDKVREKANEIAEEYEGRRINAISNVFADFIGIMAFALVLFVRKADIAKLKSFIDKIIYGLSDTAKAFAIILFTDIFVGFHSTHGWEVLLESLANHLGIAANESAINLFIATVPVVMDTIAKYWIFRYLSQMSASTVATLKEMNE
ncbi:MAG: proton extrusion protein PcxA [Xenococcaceae cyanobacterium MO_167.B27]|nr:proton extrusion protein PcxA [Xenococcaceae cyanobacterium MO_167.B27]